MTTLYQRWLDAKKLETAAVKDRRDLEDSMVKEFALPKNFEGTVNQEDGGYKIKMEGKINRKVDSDKLQMLAAEAGLSDHLATLFRWKPEINMDVWKSTDESITKPLADAITAKPGRASFKIITKE